MQAVARSASAEAPLPIDTLAQGPPYVKVRQSFGALRHHSVLSGVLICLEMEKTTQTPRIGTRQFEELVTREMGFRKGFQFEVEEIGFGFARLRLRFDPARTRPGRTVAGPVIFTLADSALFAAVLSVIGPEPRAVTTDMAIHFLRRPAEADMLAEARLMKLSGRLLVGNITLWSQDLDEPVAQATGSYAIPGRGTPGRASQM